MSYPLCISQILDQTSHLYIYYFVLFQGVYSYTTKYHKLNGLKQHICSNSQFLRPGIWSCIQCLQRLRSRLLAGLFSFVGLRVFLAGLATVAARSCRTEVLISCSLSSRGCSQLLETTTVPFSVAPSQALPQQSN